MKKKCICFLLMIPVIPVIDILKTSLSFLLLKRLREANPEMFDGRLARISIEAAIEETVAEYATLYDNE